MTKNVDIPLSEQIANDLTKDILSKRYAPGDRLPSERDLSQRFDANRGAVREAIKKLESLGIVTVQPGGARVAPVEEASLDVVGHMLLIGEGPDPELVDQIMQVLSALLRNAAQNAMQRASDEQIGTMVDTLSRIRAQVQHGEEPVLARLELMRDILEASGNLVTRLIARGLMVHLVSRMQGVYVQLDLPDPQAYCAMLEELAQGLLSRDISAVGALFDALSEHNRQALHTVLAQHGETQPTEALA